MLRMCGQKMKTLYHKLGDKEASFAVAAHLIAICEQNVST